MLEMYSSITVDIDEFHTDYYDRGLTHVVDSLCNIIYGTHFSVRNELTSKLVIL